MYTMIYCGCNGGECDLFSPLSYLYTQTNRCSRKEYAVSVTCDMSAIAHRLQSKLKNEVGGSDQQCGKAEGKEEEGSGRMRFRARIRPDESECAEEELRKEIRYVMVMGVYRWQCCIFIYVW